MNIWRKGSNYPVVHFIFIFFSIFWIRASFLFLGKYKTKFIAIVKGITLAETEKTILSKKERVQF